MVIAIVVVFIVAVAAASGRGARMSAERGDYVPLDLGPVSATDVVLLRPPTNLWGYNVHATDDAMDQIAASIRERDVRIVALEQLVTDLSRDHAPAMPLGSPYVGARHRRETAEAAKLTGAAEVTGAAGAAAVYPARPGFSPAQPEAGTAAPGFATAQPGYAEPEPADTRPDGLAPVEPGPEQDQPPFDAARPASSPPPERSHD